MTERLHYLFFLHVVHVYHLHNPLIKLYLMSLGSFPDGTGVKELPANAEGARDLREDPLEKEMATHSSIFPRKFHGQRSLAGYSPWGHEESDATVRVPACTHMSLKSLLFLARRKLSALTGPTHTFVIQVFL